MFLRKTIVVFFLVSLSNTYLVAQSVTDMLDLGIEALSNGNEEEAIKLTKKAFYQAKSSNDHYDMVKAKGNMAYISIEVGDFAAAQVNAGDAYGYLKKLDTVDLYRETLYLSYLGLISTKQGDYNRAADIYEIAYQTAKAYVQQYPDTAAAYSDTDWLYSLPLDKALALKSSGNFKEAGDILLTIWDDTRYKALPNTVARVNTEIGLLQMDNGEIQSAQSFFGKVAFTEDQILDRYRAIAFHNLAWTYMEQKDYSKSREYYLKADNLKAGYSASADTRFRTLLDLGELEYRVKNYEEAIDYWNQALNIHKGIDDDPKAFVIYELFEKAYAAINSDKAQDYANLYTSTMADWIKTQGRRSLNPALAVFSTRVDNIIAARETSARRLSDVKRYWPYAAMALVLIAFFLYQVQIALNKRRDRIYERNLKTDRALKANEILKQIRRD